MGLDQAACLRCINTVPCLCAEEPASCQLQESWGGGGRVDKLRLNHPCQQGACMALSPLEEDGTQAFAHSLLGNLDFFPWLAGFEAFSDTRWGKETTKI